MTIMLKKNGQLIIDPAPPLEGKDANLDNLAAFISDPQDGNAIVYNATKGIWEAGEVSGGGSGGMVVKIELSGELMVADHTWKEIYDALSLMPVTALVENGSILWSGIVSMMESDNNTYRIDFVFFMDGSPSRMVFHADSEDGYPYASADSGE